MKLNNLFSHLGIFFLLLGMLMTYVHVPGAGVTLLFSILYSFIVLVVTAVKGTKNNPFYKESLILQTGSTLFIAYIVFRIMFWGFTKMIFPLILIAIILGVLVLFSRKFKRVDYWLVWFLLLFGTIGLTQVRSYQIFELKYHEIIEKPEASYHCVSSLDRYAWFLNLAKKYDEAEASMDKAIELYTTMEEEGLHREQVNVFNVSKDKLMEHQKLLNEREWKSYN